MSDYVTGFVTKDGIKKYDYFSLANLPPEALASVPARIAEVTLLARAWTGDTSPYAQIVNLDGITVYSQVDLTPSVEQLVTFYQKDLAFVTENDDGIVTVYAIGDKPKNDYTIQVTIKEVMI